ncbi:MAG: 50S ribosomal protein L11 methyltransferase [Clostridiales bacterium]|nr:50S ribosomal protein L11 methyltransferase [Clostridiales bacterium]
MKYIEVKIVTTIFNLEQVEIKLLDMGIAEYIINDPRDIEDYLKKKQSYDWDFISDEVMAQKDKEPELIIYFNSTEDSKEKLDLVKKEFRNMSVTIRDDKDWKDKWKEYFVPINITDKLVIKPSWCDYDVKDGEVVLEIDPGMAFGTGTHETTSMSIKLLEKYIEGGMDVLDVGTGTGILAIAAKLLGAENVLGVDIDPEAITAAKENSELNKLDIEIKEADLTKGVEFKADIIVANLVAGLNVSLALDASNHLKDGGIYISSGILIEQEENVIRAIEDKGFDKIEVLEDGIWCAIVVRKKK